MTLGAPLAASTYNDQDEGAEAAQAPKKVIPKAFSRVALGSGAQVVRNV